MAEVAGVGERLRAARQRRGWTHDAVAEQLGISRVTVSNHERGATVPDEDMLKAYARLYETSVPLLRYGTEGAAGGEAGTDRFYEGVLWMAERVSAEITAGLRDARLILRGELPASAPAERSSSPPTEQSPRRAVAQPAPTTGRAQADPAARQKRRQRPA